MFRDEKLATKKAGKKIEGRRFGDDSQCICIDVMVLHYAYCNMYIYIYYTCIVKFKVN